MDDLELLDFLKESLGEEISGDKMLVLYASETGNAAEFAGVVAQDLQKRGVRVKTMACDDFDVNDLHKQQTVLFLVATCGQGELPANAKTMYAELLAAEPGSLDLSNTQMAVFGMGDSHYVYFNEAAKLYDAVLRERHSAPMLCDDYGRGDDQDEEKYESAWEEFAPPLFTKLLLPEPERILLPATYAAELRDEGDTDVDVVLPAGARLVDVVENRLLTPTDYDRDTRHYEFDTAGMAYDVGDSLGVYAHNDAERVRQFCAAYGLDANAVVALEDKLEDRKEPLPTQMSVQQLFTQVLDLFGRPKRRFYELLSLVATDDAERMKLEQLAQGGPEYAAKVAETVTHADLLLAFGSARPSLAHLIDFVPRIKPRLYSIASSPQERPDNIALCVVVDDWTTPGGTYKRGLCSDFLTKQSERQQVVAKVNAGVVAMPTTHTVPMVMAGLGTGLAPLRGMVRDRAWAIENDATDGEKAGDMALFFGARYRRNEFLYESEWERFHDGGRGPLTHLRTAFSRDQAHKVYIQDRIMEEPEMIHDYLVNQKGYFYACGSSAVQDLKHYVAKCIAKAGNIKEEEAAEYVTQMMIENRYCIESW